jgi:hypothetical protein
LGQPTYVNIVNNWFKLTYNKVFSLALLLLMVINVIGSLTDNALIMKTAMPLFIPVYLIFYFIQFNSLRIVFIAFLLFSFLGDTSSMFFSDESLIQASSILYLLSYLYLIIMAAPKFKITEVDKLIGAYLFVVFIITLYFLYIIYSIMQTVIANQTEVLLFGVKSLALIILTFVSFGVYLNTQTKQSVLFLTAVVFFCLSVILNYINLYYLYNWSFVLLQRILYAIALYVIFKYIMAQPAKRKLKAIQLKESYSSDNVLA